MKNTLEKILGFEIELTGNPDFGDYTANIALTKAKEEGKTPRDLAGEMVIGLKNNKQLEKWVEKIDIAGPGFINFWLKTDVLISNLIRIDKEKEKYGTSNSLKGKKIMFEFAHPNTHKAFHIGHLRNIITGESLSRLHEAVGVKVIRANYQGDIGLHIAKALYGIEISGFDDPKGVKERAEYLGKVYAKGATVFEESDDAKERVGEINKKIYDKSDSEINKLYDETRKWSLDYFDSIYKRVHTKFDRLYFESECAESGKNIALDALKRKILEESEGAIIFPGSKYGLHDRVFISAKGVPTYEAKDFGLVKKQIAEFDPDKIIHVLGPEQLGYTSVIFKAQELTLPETKGKQLHLPYGWVKLKEGKMSSRTGNVVLGEKILDDAKTAIQEEYKTEEKIAEQIAVAAVKYSFLKTNLNQDIAFDLKESISLEGNSGPYLQYTVARCNSVLSKAPSSSQSMPEVMTYQELAVLRLLMRFGEVVEASAVGYSPNTLCNYLYDLAQKYNAFYNADKIIGSSNEDFRLALTAGTSHVLKNGLKLLGIQAPERM